MPDNDMRTAHRASRTLLSCLASCGLTLVILLVVYALRGLWPFGGDTVSFVDSTQFFAPDYYTLWDMLHGAKAVGLNWFSGLAESGSAGWAALLSNNVTWTCLLNPVNWVFFFVARDQILEGLNLYLAAYMVLTSLSACLMLRLRFSGLRPVWSVLFSLMYTFSGYVLQYYFSFGWFQVLILFPILLFGLERLLREGKYILYTVIYTIFFSLNVYFGYMATVYILLFSFAYLLFLLPKEQRGDRVVRLGLSTAAALGIGAYFWTSNLAAFTGTSRFDSNLSSGLIQGLSTWNIRYTAQTTLMLLGTACLIALLLRRPKDKKRARFFAFLLGALLIPVVFTNIDAAWHFGQYNMFPMRYGFMLPATMICAAASSLASESSGSAEENSSRHTAVFAAAAVLAAAGLILMEPHLITRFHDYNSSYLTIGGSRDYWLHYFVLFAGCGVLFTVLYFCLFRLPRRASVVLVSAVLILQLGINAFALIAPEDNLATGHEFDPSYVDRADEVYAYFADKDISPLSRSKNVDNCLNAGYPAVAGVYALSSVNSLNSSERLSAFRSLGYSTHYFRLLDTGGTVFSDMLLGVDRALALSAPTSDLYEEAESIGSLYVADAKYPGVTGLQFPAGALDSCLEEETMADRLNILYKAFTGSEDDLACEPSFDIDIQGEGLRTYTLTCQLQEDSFVYLFADGVYSGLSVEGQPIVIPSYMNENNTSFPISFNSNQIFLGQIGGGSFELTLSSIMPLEKENFHITALRSDLLSAFYEDARRDPETEFLFGDASLTATLNADGKDLSLFLPMTFSERWQCQVNGTAVEPNLELDTLMSIPLQEGENTVELTYRPSWIRPGAALALSVLCTILAAVWLILRRIPAVQSWRLPGFLYTAASWLFILVVAAVILFIYAAPTVLLLIRGTILSI